MLHRMEGKFATVTFIMLGSVNVPDSFGRTYEVIAYPLEPPVFLPFLPIVLLTWRNRIRTVVCVLHQVWQWSMAFWYEVGGKLGLWWR